jgi:hypothetical protein
VIDEDKLVFESTPRGEMMVVCHGDIFNYDALEATKEELARLLVDPGIVMIIEPTDHYEITLNQSLYEIDRNKIMATPINETPNYKNRNGGKGRNRLKYQPR